MRNTTPPREHAFYALLCALAVAHCGHTRPRVSPDLTRGALDQNGRERTFLAWRAPVPNAPLVIALHGRLGDGAGLDRMSGLTAVAQREGFTVVFPDGVDASWHDARGVGPAAEQGVDDVAFISRLIDDHIEAGGDKERVYVIGMSNGGFMALTLACRIADKLAGVASVTGAVSVALSQQCTPARPVPVALFLGTDDGLVPFHGGAVAKDKGEVLSAHESARFFAAKNGCASTVRREALLDRDPDDGTRIERHRFGSCAQDATVELYVIEGGGHTWPGGWQYLGEWIIGRTSRDLSASEAAWEFFRR